MRLAMPTALCGLILLHPTASTLAQRGERGQGGPRVVVGYAAASGWYAGYPTYSPGRLGVSVPYLGVVVPGGLGGVPAGQAGPGGLMLPHDVGLVPRPATAPSGPRRGDAARAGELVEIGDRSFRGGNYRRSEERYLLAAKVDRESPTPHIHLAQVAVVRGDYNVAAGHLRNAVATTRGAGWLLEARDIQAMYAEPGDFRRQIAHLESFLQTHPGDRNAWFVLGAEHFFSGHPRAASDAFLRLADRPADEALAAFTDAATVAQRTPPPH